MPEPTAPDESASSLDSGGPPAQPWGAGKVRPTQPEPRPPAVVHLGVWWLFGIGIAVGIAWAATDHMLRATLSLGGACLLGAFLRLVLPARRAGGLVTRSRAFDVIVLIAFGAAILATGFTLDLRARV